MFIEFSCQTRLMRKYNKQLIFGILFENYFHFSLQTFTVTNTGMLVPKLLRVHHYTIK